MQDMQNTSSSTASLTPAQIEKIADENGEVYRRDIWKTSWKIRSHGFWAGGLLGLFFGAGIGALATLSTLIVGVPLAAVGAMMLPVIGAFAVAGIAMGIAALSAVGLTAGAVVGGAKVSDRKKLLKDPSQELGENMRYHGVASNQPSSFWTRVIPFARGSTQLFNWRTALIFGLAGLACGALVAATGGMGIVAAATPFIAHAMGVAVASVPTAVTTCMALTTGALFGAFFGVDIPTISANATQFFADIFSGKIFHPHADRAPELAKAASPQAAVPRSAQVTPPMAFKSGTASTFASPIGSYAGGPGSQHLRRIAEQQFKEAQSSQGNIIH